MDSFLTLETNSEALFKDKGSKFYAYAYPVRHENEVKVIIDTLKTEHPKARHHCYAYRLGIDANNFRANDDGEPSGSAGKPILNTLLSHQITNVLVVVVRYFGGTLLGVPGLINAYKTATDEALKTATLREEICTKKYIIWYDFEETNPVMMLLKKFDLTIEEQRYEQRSGWVVSIRLSMIETVLETFKEFWKVEIKPYDEV
jgi:uncharacterized YigZ family protein